jgi:hypothetical protein
MRSNVRAIATAFASTAFVIAAVLAVTPQAAFASTATHKWRFWGYKGIQVYGTWTRSARGSKVIGVMHDARKDGKWVRVTVAAANAKSRPGSEGIYGFNGGRRVYTSAKYAFSQSPPPPHMTIQVCLLASAGGKATSCGPWHKIY